MSKINLLTIVKYAILIVLALFVIAPLYYVIITSFTPIDLIGKNQMFPSALSLRNYKVVLFDSPFIKYVGNTLFVCITATTVGMFFNSMAAYGFARIQFPGKNILFMVLVATLIVPGEVLIVPMYMLVSKLGWVDDYKALIVPGFASAFYIFFLRQFFEGLPKELEESAVLDGCNRFKTFFYIMLPLIKAPLLTASLLIFFGNWDGFLWPLTVINSPQKHMIQVAITLLDNENFSDIGAKFSNVVLSALPIVIMFLFMQKYYIAGVTSGSVKG